MPIPEEVEVLIREKLSLMGFDLYELKFIKAGSHSILRIFIDHENGEPISIKDCEETSHEISNILDEEDFYKDKRYTLEVSSPGIDRPLISEKDFKRVIGKNIRLRLKESSEKNNALKGKLIDCKDGNLNIETKKGNMCKFGKMTI